MKDEEAFSASVRRRFNQLDIDQDRLLCYDEMLRELQSLRVWESHFGVDVETDPEEVTKAYCSLFAQFHHDSDGAVSLEEYTAETKKIMLGVASGLGFLMVKMVLEEDSLLMRAVERE
ncbi:Parvalbumin [Parasponia andersonii]|uniref:Parvalbumin n=1 Tax=Parasponia andersonii TaxID=3476 RepID=A0A2P5BI58_PARAD|nr:Parvalbumin [Parasponia andersonii]